MTLGEKIKTRREELHISQEKLAYQVGYAGRSAISKLENDERDISKDMLVKLSHALLVEPSYFFDFEQTEEEKEMDEYLTELKSRDEMKMLFSVAKGATKEDIERAVAIITALREQND